MNVFYHELRIRLRAQAGWLVAIIIFMALSVVKFGTLTADSAASEALLKQFPATIQAVFGMTGLSLTTLSGYYGVLFIYLAVILAIHAGMLGAAVLADEEQDETVEFLFAKPRSRSQIVTQKLLAGVIYVVLLWLAVAVSTWAGTMGLTGIGDFAHDFWNFMGALLIVQLLLYSFGAFAAAITHSPRLPARIVAVVVSVSYLLFALVKLAPQLSALNYFSIFLYFDAADIIQQGALRPAYAIVCGVLTVACIAGTYWYYTRRDLRT